MILSIIYWQLKKGDENMFFIRWVGNLSVDFLSHTGRILLQLCWFRFDTMKAITCPFCVHLDRVSSHRDTTVQPIVDIRSEYKTKKGS